MMESNANRSKVYVLSNPMICAVTIKVLNIISFRGSGYGFSQFLCWTNKGWSIQEDSDQIERNLK